MVFVFLSFLVITARLATRRAEEWPRRWVVAFRFSKPIQYAATLVLPIAFWALVQVSLFQTSHDGVRDLWFSTLPIAVVALPFGHRNHELISIAALSCFCAMSLALIVICWKPPDDSRLSIATAFSGCAMAMLAVTAPVLTSTDVYFYVFAGAAGLASYDPPAGSLSSSEVVMNQFIPLRGLIYGPLWIAVNSAIVSLGHTTAEKIEALRVANALLMLLVAYTLRALRTSLRAQLAFILNPMLWFYLVMNGHNDLIAILPCLLAILAVPNSLVLAVSFVAFAGCIKLPFLVVGMLAFVRVPDRRKALEASLAAIALCLGISWLFGGTRYVHDLLGYVHARGEQVQLAGTIFVALAGAVSAVVIVSALWARRLFPAAAFLIPYLSPLAFPWYLLWGLPYAILTQRGLAATLFAMPMAAVMMDATYDSSGISQAVFVMVTTVCIVDTFHTRFARSFVRFKES